DDPALGRRHVRGGIRPDRPGCRRDRRGGRHPPLLGRAAARLRPHLELPAGAVHRGRHRRRRPGRRRRSGRQPAGDRAAADRGFARPVGLLESGAIMPGKNQAQSALEELEALREPLTSDMPIEELERFEDSWKQALDEILTAPLTGSEARQLAAFQRDVGLLPKYKSYAIKASSPLGYSVFFQEPAQGFSFQQHRHHKVEIFHILDAMPGAFALICTLDEWNAAYEKDAFSRWLEGSTNPLYERWRIPLSAGDVICLKQTGVVHTVIGCVLEEFATISTDLVDRLHDQNEGAPIPESYCRELALQLLRTVPAPPASQEVLLPGRER